VSPGKRIQVRGRREFHGDRKDQRVEPLDEVGITLLPLQPPRTARKRPDTRSTGRLARHVDPPFANGNRGSQSRSLALAGGLISYGGSCVADHNFKLTALTSRAW
jgi:hypothetical protein